MVWNPKEGSELSEKASPFLTREALQHDWVFSERVNGMSIHISRHRHLHRQIFTATWMNQNLILIRRLRRMSQRQGVHAMHSSI
jgi:chromosome condensin MukBEF complex kleisin-like MukF subunit